MRKILSNMSIKSKWFVSYIIILILSVFICSASYFSYEKTLKELIVTAGNASLSQFKQSIDSVLTNLQQFTLTISSSSEFDAFFSQNSSNTTPYFRYKSQITKMKQYKLYNSTIDDYYIYLPVIDKILTTNGIASTELAYEMMHSDGKLTYEQWHNIITQKNSGSFFVGTINVDSNPQETISFLQTIYNNANQSEWYNLYIISSANKLWAGEGNHFNDNFLILKDKIPIYNYKSFEIPNDFLSKSGNNEIDLSSVKSNYVVSTSTSDYANWTYTFFTPYSVYWAKIQTIKAAIIISIAICLLFGILAAIYFTMQNYRPIKDLLGLLKDSKPKYNEFSFITKSFADILDEKTLLSKQNINFTQNIFIERLLKGFIQNTDNTPSLDTDYVISFDKPNINVITFSIEDSSTSSPNNGNTLENTIERTRAQIINVASEIFATSCTYYFHSQDDCVFCIINFEVNHDEILSLIEKIKVTLSNLAHIETTVAISSIYHNPLDINKAYNELIYALKYKLIYSGNIIKYDDISNLNSFYNYTPQDENKIVNFIKAGENTNATLYINNLFELNFKDGLSIEGANCFIYGIITLLLSQSDSATISYEMKTDILSKLSNYKTIDAIKVNIEYVLNILCDKYNYQPEITPFINTVIKMVKQHYSEIDFSVAYIGYKLNKSPSYISRLFKKETGQHLSVYINIYRIEIAKNLLKETDNSIKDIALQVGFSNSNVFITAFKKIEGVSPGVYKNQCNS